MIPFKLSAHVACFSVALTAALLAMPAAAATGQQHVRMLLAYQPNTAAEVQAEVVKLGGKVTADLHDVDAIAVSLPANAVAKMKAHRNVEFMEEDATRTLYGARAFGPAAPSVVTQGSQVLPYGISMVQADQITGTGSWRPKVCIVDSGIDASHEDLARNMMSGANFTESGQWSTDELGHGTHVAGTVAARYNNVGVVGVNGSRQVSLFIAKVFGDVGSASSSTIAQGMAACLQVKANVVSMSLGGSVPTGVERRVIKKLHDSGALIIAAAGNGGNTAVSYPAGFARVMSVAAVDANRQWAPFSQYNDDVEIAAPGVGVLSSVPMGTGRAASLAVGEGSFQVNPLVGSPVAAISGALYNFGTGQADDPGVSGKVCLIARGNITFADKVLRCQGNGGIGAVIYNNAPGNFLGTLAGVETSIPSMSVSQADGATLMGVLGQQADLNVQATNYDYFNGTSMATPHVSAVAALVWSFYPQCTAQEIRVSLRKSARDLRVPGDDNRTGHGLVQAKAAFDRIASLGCGL